MGEPRDAEFERRVRRDVHERYKKNAKVNRELVRLLAQAKARIEFLEFQLAQQTEIVEMAERIISDGTIDNQDVYDKILVQQLISQIHAGLISIDEAREQLGLPPWNLGE